MGGSKKPKAPANSGYDPNFSPQQSLDPRYSPRSSSVPKHLPVRPPDPVAKNNNVILNVAVVGSILIALLFISQTVTAKRSFKAVLRVVESSLRN